jgi:hypothetical protein
MGCDRSGLPRGVPPRHDFHQGLLPDDCQTPAVRDEVVCELNQHRKSPRNDRNMGLAPRWAPAAMPFKHFAIDRLGQDGGGGGAVARHIARFPGRFLDELGPDVLVGAFGSISSSTVTPFRRRGPRVVPKLTSSTTQPAGQLYAKQPADGWVQKRKTKGDVDSGETVDLHRRGAANCWQVSACYSVGRSLLVLPVTSLRQLM